VCAAYHGISTGGPCDPNPCVPQPPQACCLPGDVCENLDPSSCLANGGIPQGLNTDCDSVDCPPSVAAAASTFDNDLEDWTEHEAIHIWWEQTTGNPGGFLESVDLSRRGAADARAPAAFTGDWSGLHGSGAIRWDVRCVDPGGAALEARPIVKLVGPGGAAIHQSECMVGHTWRPFEVPLHESLWTVTRGTWQNLLAEVQELLFDLDLTNGNDQNGLDNVIVYGRALDCNGDGTADTDGVLAGTSLDCNCNYIPDECDINPLDPDSNGLISLDANGNGVPDECEACPGDMNCDGSVSFFDINPFVLYLSNFAAWQANYPGCNPANGDTNQDGAYPSFGDINAFVSLLSTNPIPQCQ
jgi:hypothetical protein